MRGCLEGDEKAWQSLLDRYASLILSIPRRYGMDAATCDDVFADVCLTLVRSLHALRDAQALPQWLIRTTTRATWNVARTLRRRPPEDLPPLTGAAPPDDFIQSLEDEQTVREALAKSPERCRRLLTLLYFENPPPSYDQIARKLGVPRGSLGPTRRRCLEGLRRNLSPRLGGDVSGGGVDAS
ncbi:MAG: RNA polymerase sigma factor [Planctomycetota bacterium]